MEEKEFDFINVIPLVDVMLVLTTSTFIATGAIPVELPKASEEKSEIRNTVSIEIDGQGTIFLNAKPVSIDALRGSLIELDRSLPVLVRADRGIYLQRFVDVLDVIKSLGFVKVSLQTEKRT